jgi:hypothetical protein
MIKKYRDSSFAAATCIVLLCLFFYGACTRSSAKQATSSSVVSNEKSTTTITAQPGKPPFERTNPQPDRNTQSQQTPQPLLAAGIRAFSLGARTQARMPEDFSLGKLQSLLPADKSEQAVLAVVQAFLAGLRAGKVDANLYLPEARDALSFLIGQSLSLDGSSPASSFATARIGAISLNADTASLRLRLRGAKDGAPKGEVDRVGLLSLREKSGVWYIEALSLDPPDSSQSSFKAGSTAGR